MTFAPDGRAAGGSRALMLWSGTAITIAAGYALLARGGTTLPAALLVLGYVLLAPLAMYGAGDGAGKDASNPPYKFAALVAAGVLLLYTLTLAPTTAMWDASEYMAAAKDLGIPHPPGNPLFVLIAYLFGTLPIAHDFAARINMLAATASALSAALWFLIAHEVTRKLFEERWAQLTAAAVCALVGATSFTVWNQSVVNEKVYTVSLLQLTVVVWLAVRWTAHPRGTGSDRLLLVIAYLLALGYTIHPAGYLAAPCVAAVVLLLSPRTLLRPRLLAEGALVTVLGLSLFAFEPIRSANHPTLNEGEPTACTNGFAVGCTLSGTTLERLRLQVGRAQYEKPELSARQAPFGAQLGMWWQYFTWQVFRDPHSAHPFAQTLLALIAVMLAVVGASTHARADKPTFMLMAVLVGTLTLALIFYLNFKYGYSQSPELGATVPREVRDRDYFFLWSFSCIGVWIGLGIARCWIILAARVRRPRALAFAMPVLAIAFMPLALNARSASRAGQTFTRDFAIDLLDSVAPNGILITNGDNDTFPLWYAQDVEGYRRDVTVIVASYLGTDWLPWQLMRRGIALAASPQDADAVPMAMQLTAPEQFEAGGIHATIPAGYLTRDQMFVLRMIRDVMPTHPMYFTSPLYPRALGLEKYVVTEGLAVHLMPQPVVETQTVIRTQGGMVDLPRSLALWRGPFKGPAAFERQHEWIDPSSLVMPAQYVVAGSVLAEALGKSGSVADAAAVDAQVQKMLRIANLASVFGRD
ncbi:MAG TPA: DUF2723 domain-containing protein [Gemmatimonadaceae bacterium]|jgi:hypothetical protein|nr:DUF2723 domain-containing protein [Gemmatimonadaceae bacterium]